jgi:ribosome-binding protein aMBF1 (putative translation factor)
MLPEQCRAARAWLEWTIADLASRAHVGISTVRSFESGERTPIQNNLDALRRTLEEEGIVFTSMANGDHGIVRKTRGTSPRAATIVKAPKPKKGAKR